MPGTVPLQRLTIALVCSEAMEVLQCGFLASSARDHAKSKDICSCTPVPVVGAALTRPFAGGWGFGLAADARDELYCWGVNSPTLLRKQGTAANPAQTIT